jgi:hypothetical protein
MTERADVILSPSSSIGSSFQMVSTESAELDNDSGIANRGSGDICLSPLEQEEPRETGDTE